MLGMMERDREPIIAKLFVNDESCFIRDIGIIIDNKIIVFRSSFSNLKIGSRKETIILTGYLM